MTEDEFLGLMMRWQDGCATPGELERLEAAMKGAEDLRRLFAEVQVRSLQLREVLRREAYAGPDRESRLRPVARFRWRAAAAAVAALLMAAAGIFVRSGAPDAPVSPGLAAVTYDQSAEWEGGRAPDQGRMEPGAYSLASGTVRMTMAHDGTVATFAGPARFDLVAPGHIRLHEGRLSAQVSQPEAGFTVLTDALTVLDRGTMFGVEVRRDGGALVSVVEGKVDVQPPGSQEMQRIEQGGTLLAHPRKPQVRQPSAEPVEGFEDLWPLTMGVDELSHLVEFIVPRAKHRWQDFRSNTRLYLMPERQRVPAGEPLLVDIAPGQPPDWKKRGLPGLPVPAGTALNSYLLFFRPAEATPEAAVEISGSIMFAQRVLGIISDRARLLQSDESLGHPRVAYRDRPGRGIEPGRKTGGRDVIRISRDGRRVYFNLHATMSPDEFRVLVAAP